jgi:protein-L-isoaspartate(D-aspartate) O-methyltransferase
VDIDPDIAERARDGICLASRSYCLAGFVPLQGAGSYRERVVSLGEGIALRLDDEPPHLDVQALAEALSSPRLERWSGAAFDLPDELELFLVTTLPQVALLHASERLVERGLVAPSAARGVPALISGGTIAYRTKRANEETGGFESGVVAHGPQADAVAARYVDLLRQWAGRYRRRGAARIRYIPTAAGTADPGPGRVAKRHGSIVVSWPQARAKSASSEILRGLWG